MLKTTFFGLEMTLIRMRRLKVPTLIATLTIAMITSITLSLTWGTTLIQTNMVSDSLDSILTDYNVRIIDEDSSDINIQGLAEIFSNNSDVERAIIKLFPNPEIFNGSFLLSRNSTVNLPETQNDFFTTLYGFSSLDFEYYQHIIKQAIGIELIDLNDNDTIVSSVTAKRLNLTVGDSLYLYHQDMPNSSSTLEDNSSQTSYCVKVVKIWDLTVADEVFNDITEIPIQRLHEIPKITDFVIMGTQTYLNCINYFFQDVSNTTILNNGIISVFTNHESLINRNNITSLIDRSSQITNSLWLGIEYWKPVNTEIIWSSNLENEITTIFVKISDSTFNFVLFGILLICLLLVFYLIFVQLRIYQSKHHLGLLRLRGASNFLLYSNYLSEGGIQGVFGGLLGVLFSTGLLIGMHTYFFPDNLVTSYLLDFLYLNSSSLILTNVLIGLTIGLIGHTLIFLQVNDLTLKELILRIERINQNSKKQKQGSWRFFFIFSFASILSWIFFQLLTQFDIGGAWSFFLLIAQDILSLLLLLTPISLIIGLLGLFVQEKDRIEKIFFPLFKPLLKGTTPLFFKDFWRRSRHTSILILLVALTTLSAISPTILVATQKKIAEKNIIEETGSDIRLNGEFRQFETSRFQNFIKNNSNIISSSSYIISQTGYFFGGSVGTVSTPMIALNTPTTYMKTILFEDLSVSLQKESEEILNLVTENNIIVPNDYYEKYYWNIGDIRKITLSGSVLQKTVNFCVIGFYQWLPGLDFSNDQLIQNGIICSFDYLVNQTDLLGDTDTTVIIRLDRTISEKERDEFYQIIRTNLRYLTIEILEDTINEHQSSFEGRFSDIFDIIFLLAIILGSVGIGWFILSILQAEKQELAIFRSRGMSKLSLIKINITRILLIELLGTGTGVFVGIITIVLYIDSLLPNFWVYNISFPLFPFIKAMGLLTFMIAAHFLVTMIDLALWSRHDIISDLGFKE